MDTSIYVKSFFQELIKSSKTTALYFLPTDAVFAWTVEESVSFVIEWSIFMDENKMLQ